MDASGAPGGHGHHGAPGGTGADGGHAGRATPGNPGGSIDVTLAETAPFEVNVTGVVQRGAYAEEHAERVAIGDEGALRFVAYGGQGGDGGRGGDGGDGRRGSSGSNATRYSSGSDGGPGGDGGDGGDGTPGADGGRGGHVVVRAAKNDTHLFMLVDLAVGGGRGGKAGQNGRGGSGGAGGSGGSSYSWTETETYTDSNGNSQTRTTHHSNRGGNDGPPGRSGRDGRGHLHDGANGAPGTVAFVVVDGTKLVQYPWRYELRLTGLVHVDQNGDGIYEPEETVRVTKITVRNAGGMPTPEAHDVRIALVDDGWVAPEEGKSLVVPRGLAPGQSHVFAEELVFKLRLFRPQQAGDALAVTERVHLVAWLPDVRRRFEDFEREVGDAPVVVVRFPATLAPIEAPRALAPGERARVSWKVENVSRQALGVAEGRALATRSEVASDAGATLDATAASPITSLPGATAVEVHALVSVPADAPDYTTTTVTVELSLGAPDAPEVLRPIQLRECSIRTVTPYVSKKVDVLFVVGSGTTRAVIEAWRAIASALGLSSGVYDLTMEHLLDDERLAADVEGGALVFVDEPRAGTKVLPHRTLSPSAVARFAAAGVRIAVVGDRAELGDLLFATAAEAPDDALAVPEKVAARTPTKWLPAFFDPKPEHLAARARAVQSWLDRTRPHERFSVQWRFEAKRDKSLGVARRYQLGTLKVVRGPSLDALAWIGLSGATRNDAGALATEAGLMAVAAALPCPMLVRRWLAVPAAEGAALGAALRARVVAEIAASRRAGHTSREALPTLLALVEQVTPEADGRLTELLRDLRAVAAAMVRWWEWLPPLPWLRTGPRLRSLVRELTAEIAARAKIEPDALAVGKDHAFAGKPLEELVVMVSGALPFAVTEEHESVGSDGEVPSRAMDHDATTALAQRWEKRMRRQRKEAEAERVARRAMLAPGGG